MLAIGRPFVGLNTHDEPSSLLPGEAQEAVNVSLERGTIKKRPGVSSKIQLSEEVTGIFDYARQDGSVELVAVQGGKLVNLTDWVEVEIDAGSFGSSRPAEGAVVFDRLYVADGTGFKVTDGTSAFAPQIPRPSTPPTVAAVAGVNEDREGRYDYKYTYYSSTWGQESPSSNASAVVEVTGTTATVELDDWDLTTPDSRVDKIRIYRRRVDFNEGNWRLVIETDLPATTGTVVSDSSKDNDVSELYVAPVSFQDTLPAFDFFAYQAGVLWLAKAGSTDIYITRAGAPWVVDTSFALAGSGGGDNEPITGLAAFAGVLVVFKRHSIWIVSGNSQDTITARKTGSHVGCVSHHSIQQVGNLLYFAAEDGIYAFDGADSLNITERVEERYRLRNSTLDYRIVSVHDFAHDAIWWAIVPAGSSLASRVLVYWYRHSASIGRPSWTTYDFSKGVTALALVTDAATEDRHVAIGFHDGSLALLDDATPSKDDGQSFAARWKTGRLDGGDPFHEKAWRRIEVEASTSKDSSTGLVRYYLDDEEQPQELSFLENTRAVSRMRLGRRSRELTVEIWNADAEMEVQGFAIAADAGARAL